MRDIAPLTLEFQIDNQPAQGAYGPGSTVNGRVVLVTHDQEEVKSLRVSLIGACSTQTTRPYYVVDERAGVTSRRKYHHRKLLFKFTKSFLSRQFMLAANHYEWSFTFTFPSRTQVYCHHVIRRKYFSTGQHSLPSSFSTLMNVPGGEASISYTLEARLARKGFNGSVVARQNLLFTDRTPRGPPEPGAIPRQLRLHNFGAQKPWLKQLGAGHERQPPISIIPTIYIPNAVTPGHMIPISVSILHKPHDLAELEPPTFYLHSVRIDLITHTRTLCGRITGQPSDLATTTVNCINRTNVGTPLPPNNEPVQVTTRLKLTDNEECIPTFKSYTICRYYKIAIKLGLRCGDRHLQVGSTSELEILPRSADSTVRDSLEGHEPLPVYLPPPEHAPDYEAFHSESTVELPTSDAEEEEQEEESADEGAFAWDDDGYECEAEYDSPATPTSAVHSDNPNNPFFSAAASREADMAAPHEERQQCQQNK